MEEKEDAAANTDEETKPNGDGTTYGKPDVYDSRIEECQVMIKLIAYIEVLRK